MRDEVHMLIDNAPISGSMFDITVYAFHNAKILQEKINQNCYFYLPKINFVDEAIFWNDILCFLEEKLSMPKYSFKVTVIVESINAVMELDEIIFALHHRIVGLTVG
jgi:malate synthase